MRQITERHGVMNVFWIFALLLLPLMGVSYVAWHVWVLLPLSGVWRTVVVGLGFLLFSTLFLDFSGQLDRFPMPVARVLYNIGTSSLMVMLYLVMLFLVMDVGRLFRLVPRNLLYDNWLTAACFFVLLFSVFLYGRIRYDRKVRVPLELRSEKPLPREYRVVMASDLHLGYHNGRKELARWVDMMNAEHPDFILIAGDIIDISVRPLLAENMAAEFHRLEAPVYVCLGNHEYYADREAKRRVGKTALDFYKAAGICLLRDEEVMIDSSLVIIGRDDRMNHRRKLLAQLLHAPEGESPKAPPILGRAKRRPTAVRLRGRDMGRGAYTILLDHQPHDLAEAEMAGIDFQLSGHTHRGQVWPISWITDRMYECSWGSHRRGHTQYYVSSGLGIWGGRFRIGTQSEYIVATISNQ